MEATKEKIRGFFTKYARKYRIEDKDNIYELGFANSLFITQMIIYLEKEFDIVIRTEDFDLTRLHSINSISEIVQNIMKNKIRKNNVLTTLPNGQKVMSFNKHETDQFYEDIFIGRSYFKNGIVINEGDIIFDIGANIGLFSLYCLLLHDSTKVYSFETVPKVYEALAFNLSPFSGRTNLFNYGLSDCEKEAPFVFYPNSTGMSSFYADIEEEKATLRNVILNQMSKRASNVENLLDDVLTERLEGENLVLKLRAISDVIAEHQIERIDLIKIDVQKSELDVLHGIKENDWRKIKQIVIEVHDLEQRVDRVRDLLTYRGYEVEVDQDMLYKGTINYNVYAVRKNKGDK